MINVHRLRQLLELYFIRMQLFELRFCARARRRLCSPMPRQNLAHRLIQHDLLKLQLLHELRVPIVLYTGNSLHRPRVAFLLPQMHAKRRLHDCFLPVRCYFRRLLDSDTPVPFEFLYIRQRSSARSPNNIDSDRS